MIVQGKTGGQTKVGKVTAECNETRTLTSYFATVEDSGIDRDLEQASIGLAALQLCSWTCKQDLAMGSEDFQAQRKLVKYTKQLV